MDKELIDEQAEREAIALQKQGKASNCNYFRIRQQTNEDNYSKLQFDKLFKD